MKFYNPAKDPAVVNGVQEAFGLKVGDKVTFTNDYGVTFAPRVVVGFVPDFELDNQQERSVYINSDSPWFPVRPSSLKKMSDSDQAIPTVLEQIPSIKCPQRGGYCEYTEDCMWGTDGWCDRPSGNKCELEKV